MSETEKNIAALEQAVKFLEVHWAVYEAVRKKREVMPDVKRLAVLARQLRERYEAQAKAGREHGRAKIHETASDRTKAYRERQKLKEQEKI